MRVTSIQRGDLMSWIKFDVKTPRQMSSVITTARRLLGMAAVFGRSPPSFI